MIHTLRSNSANGTMEAQGDGSAAEKNFKKAGVFFEPAALPHWDDVDAPFWGNPPAQPLQKRGLLNALGSLGHLLPAFVARWAGGKGDKSRNRLKGRFRADSAGKSGTRPDMEWVALTCREPPTLPQSGARGRFCYKCTGCYACTKK